MARSIASPLVTRGRIRHYRVESAEIGPGDDTPLQVSVQHLLDNDSLGAIPKDLEEEAWLLEIPERGRQPSRSFAPGRTIASPVRHR